MVTPKEGTICAFQLLRPISAQCSRFGALARRRRGGGLAGCRVRRECDPDLGQRIRGEPRPVLAGAAFSRLICTKKIKSQSSVRKRSKKCGGGGCVRPLARGENAERRGPGCHPSQWHRACGGGGAAASMKSASRCECANPRGRFCGVTPKNARPRWRTPPAAGREKAPLRIRTFRRRR